MKKVFLASCVLAVCAIGAAAQQSGMLYVNGRATLNGAPVERSSALYPGDKINIGSGSGIISNSDGSISLQKSTSAALRQDGFYLGCGTASVTTNSGLSSNFTDIRVAPNSRHAKYIMHAAEGDVLIVARKGALRVSRGSKYMKVPAGKQLTIHAECLADVQAAPAQGVVANASQTEGDLGDLAPAVFEEDAGVRPATAALLTVGGSAAAIVITTILANVSPSH